MSYSSTASSSTLSTFSKRVASTSSRCSLVTMIMLLCLCLCLSAVTTHAQETISEQAPIPSSPSSPSSVDVDVDVTPITSSNHDDDDDDTSYETFKKIILDSPRFQEDEAENDITARATLNGNSLSSLSASFSSLIERFQSIDAQLDEQKNRLLSLSQTVSQSVSQSVSQTVSEAVSRVVSQYKDDESAQEQETKATFNKLEQAIQLVAQSVDTLTTKFIESQTQSQATADAQIQAAQEQQSLLQLQNAQIETDTKVSSLSTSSAASFSSLISSIRDLSSSLNSVTSSVSTSVDSSSSSVAALSSTVSSLSSSLSATLASLTSEIRQLSASQEAQASLLKQVIEQQIDLQEKIAQSQQKSSSSSSFDFSSFNSTEFLDVLRTRSSSAYAELVLNLRSLSSNIAHNSQVYGAQLYEVGHAASIYAREQASTGGTAIIEHSQTLLADAPRLQAQATEHILQLHDQAHATLTTLLTNSVPTDVLPEEHRSLAVTITLYVVLFIVAMIALRLLYAILALFFYIITCGLCCSSSKNDKDKAEAQLQATANSADSKEQNPKKANKKKKNNETANVSTPQ